MTELKVKVPGELGSAAKSLDERELNVIVSRALREHLADALQFKVANELLKNSKMTDDLALKLGDELKSLVAKRYGVA